MRRSLMVVVLTLLTVIGISVPASALPAATPPAAADEVCNGTSGCITVNSVTFSNRSATVVASLFDDNNAGSTTAVFWFYVGGNVWSEQTRTAANERKSIHFSETGPAGGFNYVEVYLVRNLTGEWTYVDTF